MEEVDKTPLAAAILENFANCCLFTQFKSRDQAADSVYWARIAQMELNDDLLLLQNQPLWNNTNIKINNKAFFFWGGGGFLQKKN